MRTIDLIADTIRFAALASDAGRRATPPWEQRTNVDTKAAFSDAP